MFPRIENTSTPAVKQVQVLTIQVINASLKCICFVLKVRFGRVISCFCVCEICVLEEKRKKLLVTFFEVTPCVARTMTSRLWYHTLTFK